MARFFLLFIFVTYSAAGYAQGNGGLNQLRIGYGKKYNIVQFTGRYVEGSKAVSPDLAFHFFEAGKFRSLAKTNNEYINDGLVNKKSWIALTVDNTRSYEATMVLQFILSDINTVECYTVNDTKQVQPLSRSKLNKELSGSGVLARPAIFNLNLQPGEKTLLLIHLINHGQLLYIPTVIYDLNEFTSLDSNRHSFFGIFQGIFVFIILFNLILFFATFDRIYLWYLLYAFFISLFALNEVGSNTFNIAFIPFIDHFSGQTFLFLGFAVWLLLMLQFLNVTSKNRMLYQSALLFVGIDLLVAFIPEIGILWAFNDKMFFQEFYQTTITVLFAINLLFIITSNILRLIRGSKLAFFYAAANVPALLGTVIYYSNYYNFTDIWFGWLNPIALGLSIETFVISIGFAYRFNLISIQKQHLLSSINEQRKEVTRQIIDTQEAEQKRIAADLHDELGGNLAALKMTLQTFKLEEDKSRLLTVLIDNASINARNIAHNLMPPEFDETSLNDLLHNYFRRLNQEGNTRFNFHYSGNNGHFTKHDQLIIYRIVLELANNSLRHACASEVTGQLIYHLNQLAIMVEDNGKGFSGSSVDGIGLKSIRSRVNYLDGTLNIDSNTRGTTVMIQLPYKNEI